MTVVCSRLHGAVPSSQCLYSDGRRYVGHWVDDVRCGSGQCWFPSGAHYDGCWANDCMDGVGVWTNTSDVMSGSARADAGPTPRLATAREGVIAGHGTVLPGSCVHLVCCFPRMCLRACAVSRLSFWVCGHQPPGSLLPEFQTPLHDAAVATGMEWTAGLQRYDGAWVGGRRCGEGTAEFEDGRCLTGLWLNNVPHGFGKLR